jgi:hypothetical protein
VKQDIIDDIVASLLKFSHTNVISKKELHSFVGRVNHAAGLLITVRRFLHACWAALYTTDSGAPPNTVWVKQIAHALSWLRAFFCEGMVGATRTFLLTEFMGGGDLVEIGTDASPWGLGGWLSVNGAVVKYFSDVIT